MEVVDFLASDNYIIVNKDLIKKIGLNEAIMVGELASEFKSWKYKGKLNDEYFYSTVDNIENNTTFSDYQQRKILDNLKVLDILDIQLRGVPAKRYIKINQEVVMKLLDIQFLKNSRTSSQKTKELDIKKLKINNNNINNNKNNKEKIYKKEYGEFKNVLLSDEEYNKLKDRGLLNYIDKLSNYIESKGKRYKSHYATILNWNNRENKIVKDDIIPSWFNQEQEVNIDEKSKKEMENILKDID
jgi:hypothetical protein